MVGVRVVLALQLFVLSWFFVGVRLSICVWRSCDLSSSVSMWCILLLQVVGMVRTGVDGEECEGGGLWVWCDGGMVF